VHAVAVNSGTAALHAAYYAAGLRECDEIITSPLTFAATANAALHLGAKVRFVDIQPDTGNIDPLAIEAAITKRTKLIVPVDYTGHPAEYDEINVIAAKHGLSVVADAAHSFGASYKGRKVGTLAPITELSFHPVKHITTGEGGVVLTDDSEVAKTADMFRNHGIERSADLMNDYHGPWSYEIMLLGLNYRITDLQCGLGISQLRKLDRFVARRREIASRFTSAFKDVNELVVPVVREYVDPAWHLYVIRVADPERRKPFFERLRELGLGVQVHYMPVYCHPYYQSLGFKKGICPHSEEFYAAAISLPVYPKMSDVDVDCVVTRVLQAVRELL
jgi:dTDP-4-amino-4,6-dideoxygalactose transaminase